MPSANGRAEPRATRSEREACRASADLGGRQERARATYPGKDEQWARVKGQYDPANVFRVNQYIRPGNDG